MECHLLVLWKQYTDRFTADRDDSLSISKEKEYRYYTVGGLFLVFNTEPVDLSRHYKTRRGKHLLSFSLDVSGIVACSMVFVKNPGTRREWVDKSSMCNNGRLSGVPIFGNGDF